jgi:hypothetical protein
MQQVPLKDAQTRLSDAGEAVQRQFEVFLDDLKRPNWSKKRRIDL